MEDDTALIHQLPKVCGDLLNPKVVNFGLSAFGEKAISIGVCPKLNIIINDVEVLSWATINAVVTAVGF